MRRVALPKPQPPRSFCPDFDAPISTLVVLHGRADNPQCLCFHVVRDPERPCSGSHIASFSRSIDKIIESSHQTPYSKMAFTIRIVDIPDELDESGRRMDEELFPTRSHHLKIVQRHQSCIFVERRVLRLCEGLLHTFRVISPSSGFVLLLR
jgi:hypothetical protein